MSNSSVVEPNCVLGGGPEMNTDISGPGVRISFYLQALFLGVISTRSQRLEERSSSLWMLICTNIALVITSFILGFRPEPGMSLHDAVVVFYLLGLSWITIFFSAPAYNRFRRKDKILQGFYVFHSYLIFAFALAVLIKAHTFGMAPSCNPNAVVVIFGDISALRVGRIIALVFIGPVIVGFSLLSVYDCKLPKHWKKIRKWIKTKRSKVRQKDVGGDTSQAPPTEAHGNISRLLLPAPPTPEPNGRSNDDTTCEKPKQRRKKRYNKRERYLDAIDNDVFLTGIDGRLIINLFIIIAFWAIFVMNSELAIVRNHFDGGGDGIGSDLWGFGQILPMLITVLPLVNLFQTFKELGLQKRRTTKRVHKRGHRARSDGDDLESGYGFSWESESGPPPSYGRRPRRGFGHGHSRGPRRPEQAWGTGRRNWTNLGQQSGAHISQTSLHSDDSSRWAEYVGESRGRKGKERASSHDSSKSDESELGSEDEK